MRGEVVVEVTGIKVLVGGSGEESGGGLLGTVGEGGAVGGNEGSAGVAGSVGDTSGGGEDGVPGETGALVGGNVGTLGVGKGEAREETPTRIELASPVEELGSTLTNELTATTCVLPDGCADVRSCDDGGDSTCDNEFEAMGAGGSALVLEAGRMIVDRVVGAPPLLEVIAGAATLFDADTVPNNPLEVGKGSNGVVRLEIGTGMIRLLVEMNGADAEETKGLRVGAGAAWLLDVGAGIMTKLSEIACGAALLDCDCGAATPLDGNSSTRLLRCDCGAVPLLDGASGTRRLREVDAGGKTLLGSTVERSEADMGIAMLLDADTGTASLLDVTSGITRRLLLERTAVVAMELEADDATKPLLAEASIKLLELNGAAMTKVLLVSTEGWLVGLGDLVPDVVTPAAGTTDEAG